MKLTVLSWLTIFSMTLSALAATRCLDISPEASVKLNSDITNLQGKEFVETVQALERFDKLVIKTSSSTALTGTVTLAYLDVNFVEVRAGFLDDRPGNFRLTWDDQYVVGRIIDSLNRGNFEICKKIGSGEMLIEQLDAQAMEEKYPLNCGVSEETLEAELNSLSSLNAAVDQKDDPRIWNDDVIATQTFLVIYVRDAMNEVAKRGGINNMIAQGLALGNLCLINSGVKAQLVLAHSEVVDYTCEGNGSRDLSAFNSGYPPFDQVPHLLRAYGADFKTFVPDRSDVAGLAGVASSCSGIYNKMPYHLIHCGYMAGHSWIHEIGHNIGGQHAASQGSYPGPTNGGLFGHSVGSYYTLRGLDSFGSIMSYAANRTDNYSDYTISIEGEPLGVNEHCHVALTWQKIRKYNGNFRQTRKPTRFLAEESFDYPLGTNLMWQCGGAGWSEPWWTHSNDVFKITGGLEYPGLHSYGNAVLIDAWTSNSNYRLAGVDEYGYRSNYNPESDLWCSFLLSRQSASDSVFGFGFGNRVRLLKREGSDNLYYGSYDTGFKVEPFTTNLFLARINCKTGYFTVWQNPSLLSPPTDASGYTFRDYFSIANKFVIDSRAGAKFIVDEIKFGFSFEEVVAAKHPQDPKVIKDHDALLFSFAAPEGEYDIYRALNTDGAGAVKIATVSSVAGKGSYRDSDIVSGQIYSYLAAPKDSLDLLLYTVPVSEFLGPLTQTLDHGGPYTVGQGETCYFDASASSGYHPAFRWRLRGVQSQQKTNDVVFAYSDTYTPGEYEVTVLMRDTLYPYEAVVTNTTLLTITNSYPHVAVEIKKGVPMVNRLLTFGATPSDPGTNDILEVSFNAGDGGEWTDWQRDVYYQHAYSSEGNYTLRCRVRDNYGAVSEVAYPVSVQKAAAVPTFAKELIIPQGSDRVTWLLGNEGTAAYSYELTPDFSGKLFLTPESGSVAEGGRTVLIKLAPDALGLAGEYNFSIKIGEETSNIKVKTEEGDLAAALRLSAPNSAFEEALLNLSAFGSPAGLDYFWKIDGAAFAKGYLANNFLNDFSLGSHTLELEAWRGETKLASLQTNLEIRALASRVYLEEVSLEGNTLTLKPVFVPAREWGQLRFNWGDGSGRTTWRDFNYGETFSHTFIKLERCYIQCYARVNGIDSETAFLFNPEKHFVAEAGIGADADEEVTISSGETVLLRALSNDSEISRYFWREDPFNPELGKILNNQSKETETLALNKPGVYRFINYLGDSETLSAPKVLTVNVEKTEKIYSYTSLSGYVCTNTVLGNGPLLGCTISVLSEGNYFAVTNRADGLFSFGDFPTSENLLLNVTHPNYESVLTNVAPFSTSYFELQEAKTLGYLYFNINAKRSHMPFAGACVKVAGNTLTSNDRGRTPSLVLPYGEYLVEISGFGLETMTTNVTVAARQTTYTIEPESQEYTFSGLVYGTGDEIITNAQIQVLCQTTQNIVQRYNLDGMPFFDLALGDGQTTLRVRPNGPYDREDLKMKLANNAYSDLVLTPEPTLATFVFFIFLALHCLRKHKN